LGAAASEESEELGTELSATADSVAADGEAGRAEEAFKLVLAAGEVSMGALV
jgi:hypothetical protein